MRNSVSILCLVCFLSCTKTRIEPLFINQSGLTPVNAVITEDGETTTVRYSYNEAGNVLAKQFGTEEHLYTVNTSTQQTIVKSSDGVFCYWKNNLMTHDQTRYLHNPQNRCYSIIGSASSTFDTSFVKEADDTIVTLRNGSFFTGQMRTEHTFFKEQSTGHYVVRKSNLYIKDDQGKYNPLENFVAKDVFRVEYNNIEHHLKKEILEEIFRLRDFIECGTGYDNMNMEEALYLENKLPLLLPRNITTRYNKIEFIYEMDSKGLLSTARITRRDSHGFILSVKTVKFNYSNDREGV